MNNSNLSVKNETYLKLENTHEKMKDYNLMVEIKRTGFNG